MKRILGFEREILCFNAMAETSIDDIKEYVSLNKQKQLTTLTEPDS